MSYKETINLPHTNFQMQASLPKSEPNILRFWDKIDIYKELRKIRKGSKKYILHDGPPYANGHLHIGHALDKILKDIVIKYKSMKGFDTPYVPGWDCHGMPVEHEVVKLAGKTVVSRLSIMRACRDYAQKFVQIQKEEFKRIGIFGDWEHPYLTMDKNYESKIIENFGKMVSNGYVYRGLRPIYWCPECQTALSEHEVEYETTHSPSIWVKFKLISEKVDNVYFLIWTTTPWTLPSNVGVAINPNYEYSFCRVANREVESGKSEVRSKKDHRPMNEVYIVAKALVESVMQAIGIRDYKVIKTVPGKSLENLNCLRPLVEGTSPSAKIGRRRAGRVVLADFVSLEQGTGCVHIAPGHGYEDYQIGLKYDLPIISLVDEAGKFMAEAGQFAGKQVFEADKHICEVLRDKGLLVYETMVEHSYPHCWRCHNQLIFRATEQWFLSIDRHGLREKCLNEIDNISWFPAWCKERIRNMVVERPDWCLSRQRSWGVPIPVLYCKNCGQPIMRKVIIKRAQSIIEQGGIEAWFETNITQLVPQNMSCAKCGSKEFERGTDILDVWFDSSASYRAVLKERSELKYPADLYLEGTEQARGWFQLSLIESLITDSRSPYRSVVSHGLMLDSAHKKMSKSLGNTVSPKEICEKYGADVLRLAFSSQEYTHDFPFGEDLFPPIVEEYRKIRNTFRFLLGNLYDFNIEKDKVNYSAWLEIDKLILHKLQGLIRHVIAAYDGFAFHKVCYLFHNFCVLDLSKFYFDILKDRLYTYAPKSIERRAAQTVLYELVNTLVRLIAPILPFTTEEIWKDISVNKDGSVPDGKLSKLPKSVHESSMPKICQRYLAPDLEHEWDKLCKVRDDVLLALETARKTKLIGNSLEAKVTIWTKDTETMELICKYLPQLPSLFIVSQVNIEKSEKSEMESGKWEQGKLVDIKLNKADGKKCERCWIYEKSVGKKPDYPTLCTKCINVLKNISTQINTD